MRCSFPAFVLITAGLLAKTTPIAYAAAQQNPLLTTPTDAKRPKKSNWQIGTSYFRETGDYGTRTDTTLTYIPLSVRRYFPRGDLQVTIPYLHIVSEGDVVVIEGVPNPNGAPQMSRERTTADGLGDVVLRGRLYLLRERPFIPQIDFVPRIKFPTASRHKNLGTGEFDEGISVELTKIIRSRIIAMAEAGYTFIGAPENQDLRNRYDFSVGGGYYVILNKWLICVFYDERQSVIEGRANPQDVFFYTEAGATKQLKFNVGYELGLSESSADYGIAAGVRYKF